METCERTDTRRFRPDEIPLDYEGVVVWSDCPECGCRWGNIQGKPCPDCEEKKIGNIDKCTFNKFNIDPNTKPAVEAVKEFLKEDNTRGLYLSGPCGTGKSHLARATYELLNHRNKPAKFVIVPELLLNIRESFKQRESSEEEIIERYSTCGYLFLDDFGAEKVTDFSIETLYMILDRRLRTRKHKIFITSNMKLQHLSTVMSDRIASRIVEMCRVVRIEAEDYRLKKARLF